MSAELINGKQIAEKLLSELKIRVDRLREKNISPKLTVFLIGENRASKKYVEQKQAKAKALGILFELRKYEEIDEEELISEIESENQNDTSGIIVQLPLPGELDRESVLSAVSDQKDVDCLTQKNRKKLALGEEPLFSPPAAKAVMKVLEETKVQLKEKNVLIIGSGDLIGKPLAALFLRQGIDFKLANKFTEDLDKLTLEADVIISGVGKPALITGDMIKPGVVVIDAGSAGSESGNITGDLDMSSVTSKASIVSPVPGGVGPVTVMMLLENVIKAAEKQAWG